MIVLILPSGHGEALDYVAFHDARKVTICLFFKHWMVQAVACQPLALLLEGQDKGSGHLNNQGLG